MRATQTVALAAVALSLLALVLLGRPESGRVVAAPTDAIISNGTVQLGINDHGHLNVPGPPSSGGTNEVGLRYVPTNAESTAPGCLCEGWGAADAITMASGYANEAVDGVVNLNLESFMSDADSATSIVTVGSTLRVTHDYQPSPATPNLYEVNVTIENISGSPVDLRYRRVMDWDIEPTAFNEFVTINPGNASQLAYDSNNGFETANPLGPRTDIGFVGAFTDAGPDDHGALFDFEFGMLPPGEMQTFQTFYGAAGTEVDALAALAAVGAEVYSFGQPSTPDGPTLGTPNTFIFAFAGVGGTPIGGAADHYKCYYARALGGFAPNLPASVFLEDQFIAKGATVVTPWLHCNPVDKNGEGISNPNDHLVCYTISEASGEPVFRAQVVEIDNQFGPLKIAARKASFLCVPSVKHEEDGGDAPAQGFSIDHFKCYDSRPLQAFNRLLVRLEDQFEITNAFVIWPLYLCNPVDKNDEGIRNQNNHLVCYFIANIPGHDKFTPRRVEVDNQFGENQNLVVWQPLLLCVPSTKAPTSPGGR